MDSLFPHAFGCSGDVYLCIEGGAGVAEEAQTAFDNGTSMAKQFKSTLDGSLHSLAFQTLCFSGFASRNNMLAVGSPNQFLTQARQAQHRTQVLELFGLDVFGS